MNINGQIENKLKVLKLTGMLQTLETRHREAQENNDGYLDFLMALIEDEYEKRQSGKLLCLAQLVLVRPMLARLWAIQPAGWVTMCFLSKR
jgi:hypothetical protein